MRTRGHIFISFGILFLLLAGGLLWQRVNPQRLSFEVEVEAVKPSEAGDFQDRPVVLIIEDLGINLAVFPSRIEGNKWQASTKGVSHLESSSVPGEKGNSILYGHNWPNLLGPLRAARPGQKIKFLYSNGETREFEIKYTKEVYPYETSVLAQTEDSIITLYTCSGFLDSKRFVVTARKV